MAFKDFLRKSLARDPRLKEMQEQRRMEKIIEEREMNANERELNRYIEEERQKSIKKNLEEFREMRKRETWNPSEENQILKAKDIFKGHKSVLHQDFEILGGKQLFKGKGRVNRKRSGINKGTMSRGTIMKVKNIKKNGGCGFIR